MKCCDNKDLADKGCGLVAVYNIGVLSGNYIDMRSIIYWFEQNKGFVLNAVFGVNPMLSKVSLIVSVLMPKAFLI